MPDLSGAAWRKSSFSNGGGQCVEVARLDDGTTAIRNSNHPNAGTLIITTSQMSGFLHGCKAGEFDDLTDG